MLRVLYCRSLSWWFTVYCVTNVGASTISTVILALLYLHLIFVTGEFPCAVCRTRLTLLFRWPCHFSYGDCILLRWDFKDRRICYFWADYCPQVAVRRSIQLIRFDTQNCVSYFPDQDSFKLLLYWTTLSNAICSDFCGCLAVSRWIHPGSSHLRISS